MKTFFLIIILFSTASNVFSQNEIFPIPGAFSLDYYTKDGKISKKHVSTLMKQNPEAYNLWKRSEKYEFSAYVLLGAEVISAYWLLSNDKNGKGIGAPLVVLIGTTIGGLTTSILAANCRKRALITYNGLNSKSAKLSLISNKNGIGLALGLNN
ncbi:MAG: hypothetical protein R2774_09330 [Saprospiraceae bacterium]